MQVSSILRWPLVSAVWGHRVVADLAFKLAVGVLLLQ